MYMRIPLYIVQIYFRSDASIQFPYGNLTHRKSLTPVEKQKYTRNYAQEKTGKVVMFVSDCKESNNVRVKGYISQLSRYVVTF